MKLSFMPEALEMLAEISNWVEEKNTNGSGIRFMENFIVKINEFALPDVVYALCRDKTLASRVFRCINIKDWVVVFRITKSEFTVHYILYGKGLK